METDEDENVSSLSCIRPEANFFLRASRVLSALQDLRQT